MLHDQDKIRKAGSAAVANPGWKISGLETFSVTHTLFPWADF